MKKLIISILFLPVCFFSFAQQKKEKQAALSDYVWPQIGSAWWNQGGTLPAVTPPFGMTHFTALTRENKLGRTPYIYEDSTIIGFIGTHQPAPWMGDYGFVSMMPEIGKIKVTAEERKLRYYHKNEISKPYYYSVLMNTPEESTIKGEIAAAEHSGIFRFTFPQTSDANIVVEASREKGTTGWVQINKEKSEIVGYNPDRHDANIGPPLPNFKGYFVIQFSKPFSKYGTWNNEEIKKGVKEEQGEKIGAYVSYNAKANEVVTVKIGTSFISIEQARQNLSKEIPDWDFEKVKNATKNKWEESLSKIKIEGATDEEKTIFYTAMFHTMLFPRLFSEYGKYYSAFDDKVHDGISYNDYSLWDTFRALHPFLILAAPDRANDMVKSMIQMYEEGGWLPMWPNPAETNIMIGTHADAVIADAYVKGIRNYDVGKAYEAMRKNATTPPEKDEERRYADRDPWTNYEVRAGLTSYKEKGYVSRDKTAESVSRTLEYAFDDFCVAQVAKGLGKMDDYEMLMKQSKNYQNVYNAEHGMMRPRLSSGEWAPDTLKNPPPYGAEEYSGFTEGGPWTYLFCVMQDIPGLVDLMGKENFIRKLDRNFEQGYYHHENEPGHHYTYLYDYVGQPWKTQELVAKYRKEKYSKAPNGISGNDDCGQMSAWYIFSAMGFYPVTPGSDVYAIGTPMFPKMMLNLTTSVGVKKEFVIEAKNVSPTNKYIQSATLNGKPLNTPFIKHSDLMNGKSLVFIMGDKPNLDWK